MWIRNCWQVGAIAREIGSSLLARTIMGDALVLFRDAQGRASALQDRCPHRLFPLSRGHYADGVVECGYHGMRFDGSGACVGIPGQDNIPPKARARAYPVVERYGWVWVWMGDAERADPGLIPADYSWTEQPGWATIYGYTHIAANYQLLVDNLLDLSHETFVHQDTIGNGAVADAPVFAEIVDGRVRAHRIMPNGMPPPFFSAVNGITGPIDRYHTTYYTPPSYIVVYSGSAPAGTTGDPRASERRTMFPIAPETRTSSHLYWAVARNNRLDDRELDAFIVERTGLTQQQDRAVLEEQQRAIGDDPEHVVFPLSIRVDAGPTLGRRLHAAALERAELPTGGGLAQEYRADDARSQDDQRGVDLRSDHDDARDRRHRVG